MKLGNFINISKTLAKRHQLWQATYYMEPLIDIKFGEGTCVHVYTLC